MNIAEITETLKNIIGDNGTNAFQAFSDHYIKFLESYDSFRNAILPTDQPETKTQVDAKIPIFGQRAFRLGFTSDEQGQTIMTNGEAAQEVFSKLSIEERLHFLKILRQKVKEHKDEIALTISSDTGKAIFLTNQEMDKGEQWFNYAEENGTTQLAELFTPKQENANKFSYTTDNYVPPVTQVIGAYNYPYALSIGGIVGALATGNSVVVSAPMKASNWVFPFQNAADAAVKEFVSELKTSGAINDDDAKVLQQGLIQHSLGICDSITKNAGIVYFVGSPDIGDIIKNNRRGKKTILETGGNNVVTVMNSYIDQFDNAEDQGKAIKKIATKLYDGVVPASGQRCTAPRMLVVENGSAEKVITALIDLFEHGDGSNPENPHHTGNPLDPDTRMGPVVDKGAYEAMEKIIAKAKNIKGVVVHNVNPDGEFRPVSDGVPLEKNKDAYWVKPVIIDWSKAECTPEEKKEIDELIRKEVFGPLINIVKRVNGLDQAIEAAKNYDPRFKLTGALWIDPSKEDDWKKYARKTGVTSFVLNEGTKDQSPYGKHGHPDMEQIGGEDHFKLFTESQSIMRAA